MHDILIWFAWGVFGLAISALSQLRSCGPMK